MWLAAWWCVPFLNSRHSCAKWKKCAPCECVCVWCNSSSTDDSDALPGCSWRALGGSWRTQKKRPAWKLQYYTLGQKSAIAKTTEKKRKLHILLTKREITLSQHLPIRLKMTQFTDLQKVSCPFPWSKKKRQRKVTLSITLFPSSAVHTETIHLHSAEQQEKKIVQLICIFRWARAKFATVSKPRSTEIKLHQSRID